MATNQTRNKRTPTRKSLDALKKVNARRRARVESRGTPARSFRNTGKPWSRSDVNELASLARQNTPTRVIGLKLGRTADSIYNKARMESISLKPINRSPRTSHRRPVLAQSRRKTQKKAA